MADPAPRTVFYITSLALDETTPQDLLAHVRGQGEAEQTHRLRDVIWQEDKLLIRTETHPRPGTGRMRPGWMRPGWMRTAQDQSLRVPLGGG